MESQASQQTVLDSEIEQQLHTEIQQAIREGLKNSNLSKVLEKYGILSDQILSLEYSIDISKLEASDTPTAPETQEEDVTNVSPRPQIRPSCWIVNGSCVTFP
ncbi:MAG: hypothetical protein AB3A66_17070 [Nodularia sp. CChRGM 3473]